MPQLKRSSESFQRCTRRLTDDRISRVPNSVDPPDYQNSFNIDAETNYLVKPQKAIQRLRKSANFVDFLEKDLKNTDEVGGIITEKGELKNIKVGSISGVSINLQDEESIIGIHTHPSSSKVEISDQDLKSTNYPNVEASIILCRDMFDTRWDGVCFTCKNMEIKDKLHFTVQCEGTTDGPARQRYVEDPVLKID